jgi:dipeptidyl aminopeptidase/acylaminoacyl peptidase
VSSRFWNNANTLESKDQTMRFCLRLAVIVSCAVTFSLPAALSAQSFTLQQVLSAPFNSDLSASPAGKRFVWVANQEGKRNLWLAEANAGSYASHALTHYDADDGQDIGDVAWTPDAESVVYVRGGDLEFPGSAAPNPALIPQGVEQDIWIVPIHSTHPDSAPRKIAEGRAPAVAPDGRTLAYVLKDQIWTIPLRDANAKPAQLFVGRGKFDSLRWSPDGKLLAFVSDRGDHSFVGVFDLASQTLRYLDPQTEVDSDPAWSPDSAHLAFLRVPPDVSGLDFKPRRTAVPWSVCVADVQTGTAREIFHAHDGQGSAFHGISAKNQIFWGDGSHIVFPWEADGWLHLYSVSADGSSTALLTPGSFEVEHAALSPDRKTIVYSSNQDDIDRRHVWEVSVAGGAVKALTHGEGIEVYPAVASDGTVAVLRSDAHIPIRPAVVSASGELHDVAPQLIPDTFPAAQLIVPQQVLFSAADGLRLHGQLFLPKNANDGMHHPALVFFHGGSRRQMLLGWHYMGYYSDAYAMNQYLASLGYIVLSVNYRSGIGYGLDFREALHYGASGASEYNDVQGAGLYLRSRADVDGSRIGVWGGSYGGYLTALALARASDLFAAGVDFHGVHDWNIEDSFAQPDYDPNADPQAARTAWQSSPLADVRTWKSPVLLMQGDDDRNVQFSNTVRLAAALRAQGTPFEEHIFPDEIHAFLLHRTWLAAYGYEADFFSRHLGIAATH